MEAQPTGGHARAEALVAVLMPGPTWARVLALAAQRGEAPGVTVGAALALLEVRTLANGRGAAHHEGGREGPWR